MRLLGIYINKSESAGVCYFVVCMFPNMSGKKSLIGGEYGIGFDFDWDDVYSLHFFFIIINH